MKRKDKQTILLVDDRPENLIALEAILDGLDLHTVKACSGNEALALILEYDFAVVLLDVQMPEMDGYETARLMRGTERTRHIPIIFVTAINKDESHVFKGYESGAVDYIFKPLDADILQAKIKVFLDLDRQRRELEALTGTLQKTLAELERSYKIIEDKNVALRELSIKDGLTGTYNHRYFQELLAREVDLALRHNLNLSCLLMDLDHFKQVNDNHGHLFGDYVLQSFVNIVRGLLRASDWLARYGGEEFVILLPETELQGAQMVAEKIRRGVAEHVFNNGEHSRRVTVSIGVFCCGPDNSCNSFNLLRNADVALYRAKDLGRNRVEVFGDDEKGPKKA